MLFFFFQKIFIFSFFKIHTFLNYSFFLVSVIAQKEGFVITGPDSNGVFTAHKLAEIIVQVSDQADNISLQVRINE